MWRASCGWSERRTMGRKTRVMYVCDSLKRNYKLQSQQCANISFLTYIFHSGDLEPQQDSQGAQIPIAIMTRAMTATLPIVEQEEEVGQWNGQLDPLPGGNQVCNSRENYNSQCKEYLNHNSNHPLIGTNDLRHWAETKPQWITQKQTQAENKLLEVKYKEGYAVSGHSCV